jgi:hypothetical protein
MADGDVMRVLDNKTVDDAFDLDVQLKNVDKIFDRVFRAPVPASLDSGSGRPEQSRRAGVS